MHKMFISAYYSPARKYVLLLPIKINTKKIGKRKDLWHEDSANNYG